MDSSENRTRKELKVPRQEPLRVSRDSGTIQKPRPPVIIYTESPKVIHAKPEEFMSLVQRLTGQPDGSTRICPPIDPSNSCDETAGGSGTSRNREECPGQETAQLVQSTDLLPAGDPVPDNIFSDLPSNTDSKDVFQCFSSEFQGSNMDFSDVSLGSNSISPDLTFPHCKTYVDISDDFFFDLWSYATERKCPLRVGP